MNPVGQSSKAAPFFFDCEVDHSDPAIANITEVALSNEAGKNSKYFIGYVKKPQCANYASVYQKTLPYGALRRDFGIIIQKMISFINKNSSPDSCPILMGYNVEEWDKPVVQNNFKRFGLPEALLNRWKFFDLAKVACHLGFPLGTTQQQLEVALCLNKLPANRHRAHADVKVVKEIWRRMTQKIAANEEALQAINTALLGENAEANVAELLAHYDPTLIPSQAALEIIERLKEVEQLPRKEIVVLFDVETTGLSAQGKEFTHHAATPRIVEFAAKILSPYAGDIYRDECFSSLVNPGIAIPGKATEIHGIRTEDVQNMPSTRDVWDQFETWVRTTHTFQRILSESQQEGEVIEPRIILVGYNNYRYDNPLLEQELLETGLDLKREMVTGVKQSWDAMPLMSIWYTDPRNSPPDNRLQTHAEFLQLSPEEAHRALGDVKTLEKVICSVGGSVNLAQLIIECVRQGIQTTSPAAGFKEILSQLKSRAKKETNQLTTIKKAVQNYLRGVPVRAHAQNVPTKKRKGAPADPDSQSFVIGTQPFSQPRVLT